MKRAVVLFLALALTGCQDNTPAVIRDLYNLHHEHADNLTRIVDEWIRLAAKDGVGVPAPERSDSYSGRFLLRVPAPVHQALALKARAAGKSLNAYCAEKLATL